MKTMILKGTRDYRSCLKNIQLYSILVFSLPCVSHAQALDKDSAVVRKPSSVEEEVLTVPMAKETFSNENLFPEDDAGILKNMRDSLSHWEETENYAHAWGLESTGLYVTPDTRQKRKFVSARLLRYADKRFSGEMKKADEGSTLYKMGKVEQSLRPNASVPLNKFVSLKLKARVLQGKAIVEVKNPWVECNATVSANGKARVLTRKDFKEWGIVSGAEYSVNDSQFLAYVDHQVTNNIKARISSTPTRGTAIFADDADARFEMMASFPFNF